MRRALSLAFLLALVAVEVAGQGGVVVNGQGGVVVNGVLNTATALTGIFPTLTTAGSTNLLVDPGGTGSVVVQGTVVGSLTGVSIGSIGATTTTLNKTAHGLSLYQGDIVCITAATTASNRRCYGYSGIDSQVDSLQILGVLSGSDTDIALTVYRGVLTVGATGELRSMQLIRDSNRRAFQLGMDVDLTAGKTGQGLSLFYGSESGSWGTEFYPITVYQWLHRESSVFTVDHDGDVYSARSIAAPGGTVGGAVVAATQVTTGAAPTITNEGVTGSTTYGYKYVPIMADGETHAVVSAEGTTATGYATLDATHRNVVSIPFVSGATTFDVYRTTSGGTPASLGKIGSVAASLIAASSFTDNGLAGDGGTAPTTNTTGTVTASNVYLPSGSIGIGIEPTTIANNYPFQATKSWNGSTSIVVLNNDSGASAKAQILIGESITGGHYSMFTHQSSGWATSFPNRAHHTLLHAGDTGGLTINTQSGIIDFGIANTLRATLEATGLTVVNSVTAAQFKLSALNTAPTGPTEACTTGEIRVAADYFYLCSATNTWVRAALTTWTP